MKQTFKTYFIPHEGNNYHPHILHTKRAVLYSAVFLLTKIIVIVFTLLLPTEVFLLPDVLEEQQRTIVKLTNELRGNVGLSSLIKTKKLYASSQLKADDMATFAYFSHTNPNNHGLAYFLSQAGYTSYITAGENLAIGFSDAETLMKGWIQSPTHYANLVDPDYEELGVGLAPGSYNGNPVVYAAAHFGKPRLSEITVQADSALSAPAPKQSASSTPPIPAPVTPPASPLPPNKPVIKTLVSSPSSPPSTTTTPVTAIAETPLYYPPQILQKEPLAYHKNASFVTAVDQGEMTLITATAHIEGKVATATVSLLSYTFPLAVTGSSTYTGILRIPLSLKEVFGVVLEPTIHIQGKNREIIDESISWKEIPFFAPTPIEKYVQSRNTLLSFVSLFDISRNLYLGFAAFFTVALLFNIFIHIRRQHYHIIAQTSGVILLLLSLWMV